MKPSSDNSTVREVIRRWMPKIRKAAVASGQEVAPLLEQVLRAGLPNPEAVDLPSMFADAEASGFEPVEDLVRWQAKRELDLDKRLS